MARCNVVVREGGSKPVSGVKWIFIVLGGMGGRNLRVRSASRTRIGPLRRSPFRLPERQVDHDGVSSLAVRYGLNLSAKLASLHRLCLPSFKHSLCALDACSNPFFGVLGSPVTTGMALNLRWQFNDMV